MIALPSPTGGDLIAALGRAGFMAPMAVVVTVVAVGLRADDAVHVAAIRRLLETKQ